MSDLASRLIALTPRLRRHARGLVRDASRADDLVQDTLERAWRYRWRFQLRPRLGPLGQIGAKGEGDGLFAWLLTIMHRLHLNAVRRPDRIELSDAPPRFPSMTTPVCAAICCARWRRCQKISARYCYSSAWSSSPTRKPPMCWACRSAR